MTTAEFQQKFPKPWRFVMNDSTFSLRAANGQNVGLLSLLSNHTHIPQSEWNEHVAEGLREYFVVDHGGGMANRPQNMEPREASKA